MSVEPILQLAGGGTLVDVSDTVYTRQGVPLNDAQDVVIYYYAVDGLEGVMQDPVSLSILEFLTDHNVNFAHAVHMRECIMPFLSWFVDRSIEDDIEEFFRHNEIRVNKEYSMSKPGCIANWSRGGALGDPFVKGYKLQEQRWAVAVNRACTRFLETRQKVSFEEVRQVAEIESGTPGFYPFVQQCICSNAVVFDGPVAGFKDVNFRAKTLTVLPERVITDTIKLFKGYVPPQGVIPQENRNVENANAFLRMIQDLFTQGVDGRIPRFSPDPSSTRESSPQDRGFTPGSSPRGPRRGGGST
jgi:hypothetical protein